MKDHAPDGRIEYRDDYVFSDDYEAWRRTHEVFEVIHQLFESPTYALDGEYTAQITSTIDRRFRTISASYSEEDLSTIDVNLSLDYERILTKPGHEVCDVTIVHGVNIPDIINPYLRGELVECYILELYEGGSAIAQVQRSSNVTSAQEFIGIFDMTPYDFDELNNLLAVLRNSQSADEAESLVLHHR